MLLGSRITVHTDHKDLSHRLASFQTQHVLRWHLLLEEFSPTFIYKPGKTNFVADALSRVPMCLSTDSKLPATAAVGDLPRHDLVSGHDVVSNDSLLNHDTFFCDEDTTLSSASSNVTDLFASDDELGCCLSAYPLDDCYLYFPRFDALGQHPFHFQTIQSYQLADARLCNIPTTPGSGYFSQELGGYTILCKGTPASWTILIPDAMLAPLVKWYHEATVHSEGTSRLEHTIRRHFSHPKLRSAIHREVAPCRICQLTKLGHPQNVGQLAPRQAPLAPWSEVHVDSLGPWRVKVNGLQRLDMHRPCDQLT